ncbi:POT family MFS transporter [Verrucomicrobiaceae bacterium N1E253]|uniref:POT family MFS transporter n=1 Tax=Oceaniferula marina TaxID=2748318 RepID=A0A851GFK8_9BACT|nr:POT family MFS transporter [Oceaniferula marina]NWK55989.1 POT family MFS transporter [Oceaniferula marina]
MSYRSTPTDTTGYPKGIPYIISNELAERFSFYGMKAVLAIFLTTHLVVMGEQNMSEEQATAYTSFFNSAVYFAPILGAILSDVFWGKYNTILRLSLVYCLGHLCLAFMGTGGVVQLWLVMGLGLIAVGAGGIKPCVSAHVGDQFGKKNSHLLSKIFNIFYLSINIGAAISGLAIPVVLDKWGPHWAFGIPGGLMVLATLFFWMGRNKFIHVPPQGKAFFNELKSREGLVALGKLIPLFAFAAMFWCLFDQASNRLVFQADKMDRELFGVEIRAAQMQSVNPVMILILIPLFTWVIYPMVGKLVKVTPLRKIGAGLFTMAGSFVVISLIQEAIDRGGSPSIGWQILAYAIFTCAEIMLSIVCLEFAYTQAPKKMKSFVMGVFLCSAMMGNLFTAGINLYNQAGRPKLEEGTPHAGMDKTLGTVDDMVLEDNKVTSAVTPQLDKALAEIQRHFDQHGTLPSTLDALPEDPWGNPLSYTILHAKSARVASMGPDSEQTTKWDLGVVVTIEPKKEKKDETWLDRQKQDQGLLDEVVETEDDHGFGTLNKHYFAGGQSRLEGAAYFWFFTKLMFGTSLVFIPFAMAYKPRTYLQEDGGAA